jgi:RimJ/RimL family protein N-acetyltransferase
MSVSLRPFARDDFVRLIAWIDSPELLVQWAGSQFDYPLNERQLERYLEEAGGPFAARRVWAAVDDDSGDVVGHVELGRIDRKNRSGSIARLLVGERADRGKGTGAAIVQAVLAIAFDEMGLHRVDLYVVDFNLAAIRLYESLGFKTEGHFVEARRVGDAYWNVYTMAMLEDTWREKHAGAR